jgi:hypothetical protein
MNIVTVERVIREDRRPKCIAKTVVQYFSSVGRKHYSVAMFKLVKRRDVN